MKRLKISGIDFKVEYRGRRRINCSKCNILHKRSSLTPVRIKLTLNVNYISGTKLEEIKHYCKICREENERSITNREANSIFKK